MIQKIFKQIGGVDGPPFVQSYLKSPWSMRPHYTDSVMPCLSHEPPIGSVSGHHSRTVVLYATEVKSKFPGPNRVKYRETRQWNWVTIQASSSLLFLTCNHQNSAYRREGDKRNDGNCICCKKIRPLKQSCSILVQWSKQAQTRQTSSTGTTRLTLSETKSINSAAIPKESATTTDKAHMHSNTNTQHTMCL